jgi:hypothetical protein
MVVVLLAIAMLMGLSLRMVIGCMLMLTTGMLMGF